DGKRDFHVTGVQTCALPIYTFGVIDARTRGGPAQATTTLVYRVYADGRLGGDLGGAAAQSVILMMIVIALTSIQFRYIERKVNRSEERRVGKGGRSGGVGAG